MLEPLRQVLPLARICFPKAPLLAATSASPLGIVLQRTDRYTKGLPQHEEQSDTIAGTPNFQLYLTDGRLIILAAAMADDAQPHEREYRPRMGRPPES